MVPPPPLCPSRLSGGTSTSLRSLRVFLESGSAVAAVADPPGSRYRLVAAVVFNAALLSICATLFWWQSREDGRPVPRPSSLPPVPLGQPIRLDDPTARSLRNAVGLIPLRPFASVGADEGADEGRDSASLLPRQATLFHFANPDCPCSRYMEKHVWELYNEFGDRLRFVAVLPIDAQTAYQSGFLASHPDFRVVRDPEGLLARAMGVYATPTAVLLDGDDRLVYRGNYNQGRFCVVESSQYARQAIEAFLDGRDHQPPPQALSSIGCLLPIFQGRAGTPDPSAASSPTSRLAPEDAE